MQTIQMYNNVLKHACARACMRVRAEVIIHASTHAYVLYTCTRIYTITHTCINRTPTHARDAYQGCVRTPTAYILCIQIHTCACCMNTRTMMYTSTSTYKRSWPCAGAHIQARHEWYIPKLYHVHVRMYARI